jgi:heavy metal translocating P-type ATPase
MKLKKIFRFIYNWRLFSIAILGLLIGFVLWILKLQLASDIVLGGIAILEAIPLLLDMYDDIRSGRYGIDILALTAIISAVLLKQYYAAIVVVIMLTGGEALDKYADKKAKRELDSLIKNSPKKAHLLKNKKLLDVNVAEVKLKDRFIVKPGELVPVDGKIIEGESSFNEASLTGESLPVIKHVGDKILSGSINIEGSVTVEATASAKDSQYQQIIKLVESAAASNSPFVRLADRYSIPFTLISFIIAGTVWYISGQAIRFLEVIIVATPCPLLLAAPIALVSGMSLASKRGIIVKNGSSLEKLAETQTIAFDKTGTLTSGELAVDNIVSFESKHTQEDIVTLISSLEMFSSHLIGTAIVKYAKKHNLKLLKIKSVKEETGKGLEASYKGHHYIVGRVTYLKEKGIKFPPKLNIRKLKSTTVFISDSEQLLGYLTLKDNIRSESKETLQRIHLLGILKTLMITGDGKEVAKNVATKLGIDEVVAEALPSDKLLTVEKIKDRPIAFVGDGVNDAPVLTAADIGIALGAKGSTAASESADIVILEDDLTKVADILAISKHTFKIARQSILWGIGLSFALMLIFATGFFLPIYGAILQEVVDVVVIFNALRAHYLND